MTDKFAIKIKYYRNKYFQTKLTIDKIILQCYDSICDEINKDISNVLAGKNAKLKNIILQHPNINKIIINNKEQWNFLYKYNIINECVSTKNALKIEYDIIIDNNNLNNTFALKNDIDKDNFTNIYNYLIKKIPFNFYLNRIFKFFDYYREIAEIFKSFFINELVNTNFDEINNMDFNFNANIKKDIEEQIIIREYNIETEKFLEMFRADLIKFNNNINNIKNIINDEKINKKIIQKSVNINDIPKNEPNLGQNIYFTVLNKKIDEKNLFEKDKLFKLPNKNEYYSGIENIKDGLFRELMSQINNS